MYWVLRFYSSSLGMKIVMAATGVILFGFIVGHLIGNLQIFAGPEVLDSYARFRKEKPEVIWTARVTLLASVGLHILTAMQLTIRNCSARPIAYRLHKYDEASYAARTMIWSGPIIGLFVIYHLLHFTVGIVHPSQPEFPCGSGVRERRQRIPAMARRSVLHPGCLEPWASHRSRRLEYVSIHRSESPEV